MTEFDIPIDLDVAGSGDAEKNEAQPENLGLHASSRRLRLAQSMKDLSVLFLSHDISPDDLIAASEQIEELTVRLSVGDERRRSFAEITNEVNSAAVPPGNAYDHFDQCFVTGRAHPGGLAGTLQRQGDTAELTVTFSVAYEGMPGFAHGGIIAAAFDDCMGTVMGRLHRTLASTASLTIDYRRPVPLDLEVQIRAQLVRRENRKCFLTASATSGGVLYASADALFVELDSDSRRP